MPRRSSRLAGGTVCTGCTSLTDPDETHVLEQYRGLWQVEETFRVTKHDLNIRPIFHWTPARVRAHIAICFMALM